MEDYLINIPHLNNARSLSYLTNKEGKRIKKNLLIRSNNLSNITDEEASILAFNYHLTKIIDLRTTKEALEKPDKAVLNAQYIHLPVLVSEAYGITRKGNDVETFEDFVNRLKLEGIDKSNKFMADTYACMVNNDHSINIYRSFIDELISANGPVLWHCSAGKDRAGFATMIILAILDFDFEDIINDYLLTNKFVYKTVDNLALKFGEDYREILECVFCVKPEYITYLFKEINKNYESLDDFIRNGLKIDEALKKYLKDKYLED